MFVRSMKATYVPKAEACAGSGRQRRALSPERVGCKTFSGASVNALPLTLRLCEATGGMQCSDVRAMLRVRSSDGSERSAACAARALKVLADSTSSGDNAVATAIG